jgi:hypothetical protein
MNRFLTSRMARYRPGTSRYCVPHLPLALSACLLCGVASATTIETVFDNTAPFGEPYFGGTCCRIGDEITLARAPRQLGEARIVQISLAVAPQNIDWLAPIELRIYANDGSGGSPGSVLWDSGIEIFFVHAEDRFVDFSIPSVVVPDTITVTSWLPASDAILGRVKPVRTAVGTFDATWIEPDYLPGVSWLRANPTRPPPPSFAIQVQALQDVDEPGTLGLMLLSAALMARVDRRRRSDVKAVRA